MSKLPPVMVRGLALAMLIAASMTASAQTAKNYVILSKGQGKGSTAFADRVAAAGGQINNNMEAIGVVTATSSDPDFASKMSLQVGVQAVAEDPLVNFLPNEGWKEANLSEPV